MRLPTHRMGFAQRYWLTSPRWCFVQASFRDQTNVTQFISTLADTLRIGFRWFHDCRSLRYQSRFPWLSRIDVLIRKEQRIQVEFSRVKKSEDLTWFNLSRGKGKLSDAALHYIAYRLSRQVTHSGLFSRRTLCCWCDKVRSLTFCCQHKISKLTFIFPRQ